MTTQYAPLSLTPRKPDQIEVTITYLEQAARPSLAKPPAPHRKCALSVRRCIFTAISTI